jgi:hypothetical protein
MYNIPRLVVNNDDKPADNKGVKGESMNLTPCEKCGCKEFHISQVAVHCAKCNDFVGVI